MVDGEEWESLVPTSTTEVIREIGGVGRLKIVSSRDSVQALYCISNKIATGRHPTDYFVVALNPSVIAPKNPLPQYTTYPFLDRLI